MYNITLKYLQELDSLENKNKESGLPNGVIPLNKAKDTLEKFEVELREYLEEKYLGNKYKQEIKY